MQLIKASCDQAGFDVQDISSADFSAEGGPASKNDYDAFLFAWASSGQLTSDRNIYSTGSAQNFGKYSNKTVDAELTKISQTMDLNARVESLKIAEKALWDDMFGIPIFQHPGLDASSSNITNAKFNASQNGITWNAEQWATAAK